MVPLNSNLRLKLFLLTMSLCAHYFGSAEYISVKFAKYSLFSGIYFNLSISSTESTEHDSLILWLQYLIKFVLYWIGVKVW